MENPILVPRVTSASPNLAAGTRAQQISLAVPISTISRLARSFKIGPYHRPGGWTAHRWGYGELLPRPSWASPYQIADYWLFALEVPPAGYEWVRDDSDALLINTGSGEILQVEYGVFA